MPDGSPQAKGNRRWRVARKPVSAECLSPIVRQIAHDEFVGRPDSDRLAQEHGNQRAHIQDAVLYELHRRIARLERQHGMSSEAVSFRRVA